MHLGAIFQYCTCHLWSLITDRQSVTLVTIQFKFYLGRRNYFFGLNHLQGPVKPLLISTKLVQKNPLPNICTFPSLTGVFKKVVNSSLEGSMRLISSHPHDAKIGSLDQDHYFTVWCFQDCGEIVERH